MRKRLHSLSRVLQHRLAFVSCLAMGNSSLKFDIISNLPPELVLIIVSHLNKNDVYNCLLVSRSWNEIVCNLSPYWWSLIQREVGLSKEAIARSVPSFSTPRELLIAARKYKAAVVSNKLKSSTLISSPSTGLHFTLCLEAKDMMIVRSQKMKDNSINADDGSNQNCSRYRLLLEKVTKLNSDCQHRESDLEIDPVGNYPLSNNSSVAWAHVAGENLYWVTRQGSWRGVNVESGEETFSWDNNLLNNGCGVTFACCKECSMMVASQWMPLAGDGSHQSAYALQVISLGNTASTGVGEQGTHAPPKELIGWKMFQTHHSHSLFLHHDSRYWIRETFILSTKSCRGERQRGGRTLCQRHTLVVQSDRCTVLHEIELQDNKLALSSQTRDRLHELRPQLPQVSIGEGRCINCDYSLTYNDESMEKHYTRNVSSGVNMSADESLLGMVFKRELHVWKLSPLTDVDCTRAAGNGIELVSKATLKNTNESSGAANTSNSIRLVALGHNLSIIAYHYDTYVMDYQLDVVMTQTGEVVMQFRRIERFYDWSLCCQVDPLHKFYFMMLDEEWLNTVQSNNTVPLTPIITVHNHHGRMHIEAIQCYKPEQSWRKHWKCFMQ